LAPGLTIYHVHTVSFSMAREPSAPDPRQLTTAKAVARLIRKLDLIPDDGREHFGAFYLTPSLTLVGYHEIALGAVDAVQVSPRDVLGPALRLLGVSRVIVVHNHPDGDPSPSTADRFLTRRLTQAAGTGQFSS
jgi:DNA repair protein RadC